MAVFIRIFTLVIGGAAILMPGCGKKSSRGTLPTLDEEHRRAIAANNELGLKLFHELRATSGNFSVSPYGVSAALSMLLAGAGGGTRDELYAVLDTSARFEPQFHEAQGELTRWLTPDDRMPRPDHLSFSNAIFIQHDHDMLKPFLKILKDHYRAEPQGVDFIARPATARKVINDWAAEKTRNQIKEVISPDDITPQTRLILANSIYFKGAWEQAFKTERTRKESFHVAPDQTVDVDMMHQSAKFGYSHQDGVRVLVMPYRGEQWSMVVVLPDTTDGLGEMEERVDHEALTRWIAAAEKNVIEVPVWLPRFRFDSGHDLKPALRQIGVTKAFDPGEADFSRIEGKRGSRDTVGRLFVDSIRQRAMIEVNEEGTEAAAVTTINMKKSEMPENAPRFRADHPFLFLIRENESGLILFLGRVVDPTKN
jgi:serpin B